MKKFLFSTAVFLFVVSSTFSQTLCLDNSPSLPNCGIQAIIGEVDGCSNTKNVDFTFRSGNRVKNYLRCTNNTWGNYTWRLNCRLYDVTDPNHYVEVSNINYDHIYINGTTCSQSDEDRVITTLTQIFSSTQLSVDYDKHLVFYFNNIPVQSGHKYGVSFRIENYSDMWFGEIDNTTQANELSQQMTLTGSPTYVVGLSSSSKCNSG